MNVSDGGHISAVVLIILVPVAAATRVVRVKRDGRRSPHLQAIHGARVLHRAVIVAEGGRVAVHATDPSPSSHSPISVVATWIWMRRMTALTNSRVQR